MNGKVNFLSKISWYIPHHDLSEHSFEYPPALPNLASALIEFEQSLVAGHPTHPVISF